MRGRARGHGDGSRDNTNNERESKLTLQSETTERKDERKFFLEASYVDANC